MEGDAWKVAVARYLRENYLAPHIWLTKRRKMGTSNALSSLKAVQAAMEEWDLLVSDFQFFRPAFSRRNSR